MKQCSKCGEQSEAQFDSCWNCTTPFERSQAFPPVEAEEVAEAIPGSLFALTVEESRSFGVAIIVGSLPLLFWWISPRAAGVFPGALVLELPALLVLGALQPKGERWPFHLVALPYALIFLVVAVIAAGLVFGGGWVQ